MPRQDLDVMEYVLGAGSASPRGRSTRCPAGPTASTSSAVSSRGRSTARSVGSAILRNIGGPSALSRRGTKKMCCEAHQKLQPATRLDLVRSRNGCWQRRIPAPRHGDQRHRRYPEADTASDETASQDRQRDSDLELDRVPGESDRNSDLSSKRLTKIDFLKLGSVRCAKS
jgi:hypothetical protein